METSKRILQKRYQGKKNSDSNAKGEYVETRTWKEVKGLTENSQCRLCKEQQQTIQYLLAKCSEYLVRHNRALKVVTVTWTKEQTLLE